MTRMRKMFAAAAVCGGIAAGIGQASALPATGPKVPAATAQNGQSEIVKAHYYRRHHRGPGLYFSFGPRRHWWHHRHRHW